MIDDLGKGSADIVIGLSDTRRSNNEHFKLTNLSCTNSTQTNPTKTRRGGVAGGVAIGTNKENKNRVIDNGKREGHDYQIKEIELEEETIIVGCIYNHPKKPISTDFLERMKEIKDKLMKYIFI